jgi:hypothetical protein
MPTDIRTFRRERNSGLSLVFCESAEPDNKGIANRRQLVQDGVQWRPDKLKGRVEIFISLIAL